MSAHRALFVADILIEIFEWYSPSLFPTIRSPGSYEDMEYERKRTLAYAARVSKPFHEAAIRILWCSLDTIHPIFNLLPSLRKVEEHLDACNSRNSYSVYSLPDHVPEHEWDRMLHYTTYVSTLRLWRSLHTSDKRLTPASWANIRRFGERRQIVPNLFSLQWIVDLAEPAAMLLFLAPSVEVVTVICDSSAINPDADTRARWAACLEHLVKECCKRNPRLTDLDFRLDDISPSSVMPHLLPLESLIALNVASESGAVDLAYARTLAAMPALESLTLPSLSGTADSCLADPSSGFRSLQALHLKRCVPSDEVFASAAVREFSIERYTYRDEPLLRQSCAAWARAFPNLRVFSIYIATDDQVDIEPRPALAPAIAPLFALRSLETLDFGYGTFVPFSVSDADVATISGAWPSLTDLSILEIVLGRDFPSCSVGVLGVLAIAQNCPALKALSLPRLDLRVEDFAALPPDPLDHRLQRLHVERGLSEAIYYVVADRIFPHLESKPKIDAGEDL